MQIDSKNIRLVIFDIDGTLYFQPGIRLLMAFELFVTVILQPRRWQIVRIVKEFRNARENQLLSSIDPIDLQLYRLVANRLGCSEDIVRSTVEEWIMIRPLKYLPWFKFNDIDDFLNNLRNRGILIATFSDYPSEDKLKALGLVFNVNVSATDTEVNALKPNPMGIKILLEKLCCSPSNTLVIGDRFDKDGQCAAFAGASYFIKKKFFLDYEYEFLKYSQIKII